jgi:hypothetical protein
MICSRVDGFHVSLDELEISLQSCAEHVFCRRPVHAEDVHPIRVKDQVYEGSHQIL